MNDTTTDPRHRFRALIERNHALQQQQEGDAELDRRVKLLQAWQCERLLDTHADLAADPRFGPGVTFFVEDLYAPKDFSARDADLERALPAMIRLLPARILSTAADGAALYVLARELDHAMAAALFDTLGVIRIDHDAYAEAYRLCDDYARRVEQIDFIGALADTLDRYVRSRFLLTTLKMTRGAARLAGLVTSRISWSGVSRPSITCRAQPSSSQPSPSVNGRFSIASSMATTVLLLSLARTPRTRKRLPFRPDSELRPLGTSGVTVFAIFADGAAEAERTASGGRPRLNVYPVSVRGLSTQCPALNSRH